MKTSPNASNSFWRLLSPKRSLSGEMGYNSFNSSKMMQFCERNLMPEILVIFGQASRAWLAKGELGATSSKTTIDTSIETYLLSSTSCCDPLLLRRFLFWQPNSEGDHLIFETLRGVRDYKKVKKPCPRDNFFLNNNYPNHFFDQ